MNMNKGKINKVDKEAKSGRDVVCKRWTCATCLQTDKEIHLNKHTEDQFERTHRICIFIIFVSFNFPSKDFLVINREQSMNLIWASHWLRYLSYSAEIDLSLSACICVLILFRPKEQVFSFCFSFGFFFSPFHCMPSQY